MGFVYAEKGIEIEYLRGWTSKVDYIVDRKVILDEFGNEILVVKKEEGLKDQKDVYWEVVGYLIKENIDPWDYKGFNEYCTGWNYSLIRPVCEEKREEVKDVVLEKIREEYTDDIKDIRFK